MSLVQICRATNLVVAEIVISRNVLYISKIAGSFQGEKSSVNAEP
jgi:hypothetical protein